MFGEFGDIYTSRVKYTKKPEETKFYRTNVCYVCYEKKEDSLKVLGDAEMTKKYEMYNMKSKEEMKMARAAYMQNPQFFNYYGFYQNLMQMMPYLLQGGMQGGMFPPPQAMMNPKQKKIQNKDKRINNRNNKQQQKKE